MERQQRGQKPAGRQADPNGARPSGGLAGALWRCGAVALREAVVANCDRHEQDLASIVLNIRVDGAHGRSLLGCDPLHGADHLESEGSHFASVGSVVSTLPDDRVQVGGRVVWSAATFCGGY